MKPWIKISLGVLLSLTVIAFIIVWDVYLKDKIDSVEVVVVKPGLYIDRHTPIQENMLLVEERKKSTIIPNALLPHEIKDVIGLEVKHPLLGNMMVSKSFFDHDNLIPNPDKKEAIYPIPDKWIYAMPSTLRRKDHIDIYFVENPEKMAASQSNNGQPIQPKSTLTIEQINQLAASGQLSQSRKQELIELGFMPALMDIPIIYAKDSSGNEIATNNEEGKLKATDEKRFYSTGMVSNLELLLTEEQYRIIWQSVREGYLLYITYN